MDEVKAELERLESEKADLEDELAFKLHSIHEFNVHIHEIAMTGCRHRIKSMLLPQLVAIGGLAGLYFYGGLWWIMLFPVGVNTFTMWNSYRGLKRLQANPPQNPDTKNPPPS